MARPKEKTTICDSGIVSLTFSPDFKRAAFSPNNHLVYIVECGGDNFADCTTWNIVATLEKHDHPVTSVDWSHHHGSILTCSHDRTAFVWKEDVAKKQWTSTLVMLDTATQKGLTVGCWSGNGAKAYFGSAAGNVIVGTYDSSNDWWHCKAIDKHTSIVTALAPHPGVHTVLATGGTDARVLLLSTHSKAVDGKSPSDAKFGSVLGEVLLRAWVNALQWVPGDSSSVLAVATHDSQLHVVTFPSSTMFTDPVIQTISLCTLPLRCLTFLSATQLIGAGYDFYPMYFTNTGVGSKGGWALMGKWTAEADLKRAKTEAEIAREKFQNQSLTGQAAAVELPKSRHKNVITSLRPIVAVDATAKKASASTLLFASGSMDGRVECWDLNSMNAVH